MYNILIDRNINLLFDSLSPYANCKLYTGRELTNNEIIDFQCDILFTRSQTKVNEELLKDSNVKLLATATSGSEHIDKEYLKQNNIQFYDARGSNANSVAEFVIYSILDWAIETNIQLNDKIIGIIGYGSIGKIIAYYANKLKLNVLINDTPLLDNSYKFPNYVKYADLNYIFENADIITNHIPLTNFGQYKTNNLIDENLISRIKANSLFVHHSRGSIANESTLIKYKKEKNLYLSIDVWENEPEFNIELAKICEIATPHISGYSFDGKMKGTKIMLDVFQRFTNITPNFDLVVDEMKKTKRADIATYNNLYELKQFINRNRNFDEDIKQFKDIINNSNRTEEFDLLRKNYPTKRECLTFSL
ncbi:MAG TPA: NAD(P)-dependent oxidoreductase [Candidatus Kapabacteria bacterium]|nr:NAD(P)-dependent oxidoreductase [Candidatus Kapabacteria bacterium]